MERLQDRGWGESICFLVDTDEVGLAVDQCRPHIVDGATVSERTSMPSVGMSVTISNSRQKVKKM